MDVIVHINEEDLEYELRRSVMREMTPYKVREKVEQLMERTIIKEVEKRLKETPDYIDRLIMEATLHYLEKYKIRDIVSSFKMHNLAKEAKQ